MISELIGMELESNSQIELTLESLDQYGVYSYHKEISKITKSAIEEEKLDNLIRELNDIWTKTRVETRVRHGILIVDNFDFLFNTWESSFITLRQLGKSRYLQQFNERLLTWSGRLEFVKTFIELLKSVQNLWAIQDVPFSCLMFKEELPSVHEYFQRTKAAFVLAMNTIIESPNILESFHNEDNYFILTDIKLHFTKTQSHLTDSLRATRLSSPRLFFLSDEELLRLLENSVGNLSALNPYLYLMFTSVQSVLFTEGDSHERCYNPFITGVCSKGGEKLMFDEPVKARLDVPHWIKTIDGDIYRTLLLELQDIMRKGIASFPQVWRDKNYLAQSQSNAAHVFWSANKDINLKELKEHCIQSIDKNTSNPSIRIKEARKLLQLLYYEQDNHSNRHDLEYVYDGNRLKVSGFGNAIQYGTEYLGYDLPFNPELTLYCLSELFHEFGVSQNAKTQRLLAGLLGKFFFSLSHFNPDLNLQNVVLGTIKLGSWTFLRDFEYVQEEDVLFLKEISIYCQLMMKDNNNLGKRFINVGGYEIPMGMFPRLRMDSSKWKIGRNFISLIQPDFQMRLRIEFVKQGHLKYESLINKLVQISRLLEPFSNNQNIDYQNKIMSALGKCTFETETDFIFYCVDKVKTLDEMKNIEHNELSHILGESWMEKFRSSETISSKLDSSFNLIVLNATELQSAVENFTCTVLNLPESMTKQKTISLSLRYLENQGYSIIKICPVSQILHPSLHLYINSIIEASNGKVVFLLHGPWNQEWVIYIGKVLMYYSNLRFILSDDSNKSEECGSKRSVQLMYDEIEEFKIIGHELSQKDFDIMYKSCILISQYILNELNEYVEAIRIMSLAINCYLQKRACDINKSLFISGAFHISIKKSVEKLHQFFMEILGVDPGIEDLKDPFDVHQLALKFSFGVKNVEPQFYVPSREQSKVIMYLKMCIEYKLSVLLCGKRGSGKSTAIRKAIKYLNNDKFETCIINMSSSQANELEKDYFVKEDAYILDKMRCYGNRVLVLILESFDIWNVKHAYFLRSLLEKSRLLWDNITKRVTPLTTYKIVTIVEVTLEYSNPNAYRDSIQRMNQFTRDLHPIHHRKDENENEMITKTILDKFITDFEKDVSETSTSIPSLINSIHESCKEHHPERVSDHNLFRVLGGILYADPEIFVRGKDFGNHVYNEIRNEYKGYGEIIYDQENIIDSKFSAKRDLKDVTSFKDSISYFYLEDGFIRIKMISLKDAMQKFSSAYSGTKGKTYNTRLVFSKSFTYLISSLIRSINRYGEVLLYGKSGHGRKSCAEFISFFLGIRLVEAPGSVEPFLKQLRTAYIDASNGEVVLLLVKLKGLNNDTIQIIRFIEEILFYGECHNLLSDNDMNEYLFDTDSQQYEANYNEKTHKDAKMALHESIREDLHFFICVEDENVHSYILKYHPFLTHRCGHHEIDYWNDDTLRSIAEDRFSGMKLSDTFPSSLTLPLLSKVSMNMQKIAVPLSKSINSFLNYLDAVRVFPSIYKPTFDHLINEKKELSSGIAQISTANELIHKLSDEISGQEPEGLRIASEIDRLQKRISQEMSNLEKASKAFRKKKLLLVKDLKRQKN
ncbi:uncharacterized protein [Lepeophtheirus salmonis]|uniref:uncharacterized protein n=1 Tax=Lepeophtheirus salmonis TaxID=72036 RepID=UPI001AE893EC|nr:uncharacterized protein LOC121124139 [Lepeophtheirus salmonis]